MLCSRAQHSVCIAHEHIGTDDSQIMKEVNKWLSCDLFALNDCNHSVNADDGFCPWMSMKHNALCTMQFECDIMHSQTCDNFHLSLIQIYSNYRYATKFMQCISMVFS